MGEMICLRCRANISGDPMAFPTARDVMSAMDGKLSWSEIKQHCKRCQHWLYSMPNEQSRLDHIAQLPEHKSQSDHYPAVMTEWETMWQVVYGRRSLARYGDGELRLALGGSAISQEPDKNLRAELVALLRNAQGPQGCLVGIPRIVGPKVGKTWYKYLAPKFLDLYRAPPYASAFVTRPDSAPWIDHPKYWGMVKSLWHRRHVIFVAGSDHSLRPDDFKGAHRLTIIEGTYRDSYRIIDQLMRQTGDAIRAHRMSGGDDGALVVILCCGATATVMAQRIHVAYQVQAIDLGHIGRMLRSAGKWQNADDVLAVEF